MFGPFGAPEERREQRWQQLHRRGEFREALWDLEKCSELQGLICEYTCRLLKEEAVAGEFVLLQLGLT